jgi:hypothetical protein
LIVLAALFCCSCASRTPTAEFALESGEPHPLSFACFHEVLPLEDPSQLKGIPDDLTAGAKYSSTFIQQTKVVFLLDPSDPPKLYVDTDKDGDLSDEKPFEPTVRGLEEDFEPPEPVYRFEYRFGPIVLRGPEDDIGIPIRATFNIYGEESYLLVFPGGFRTGRVQLDGKSYKVGVVDGNFDGRYDGALRLPWIEVEPPGYDIFAIDLNGDGEFNFRDEQMYLPKMVRVEDNYYSMRVEPDGSAIRMGRVEPEFGTLDVGTSGAELSLLSENGSPELRGSDGQWLLPAGEYSAEFLGLTQPDNAGEEWTLMSWECGKLRHFEIRPGQTQSFKIGPPLSAMTMATVKDGSAVISLSLVGQAGEQYAPGAEIRAYPGPPKKDRIPPKFRIVDEAGNVLVTDSFEFG